MSSLVEYFLLRVLYLHENFHKGMKKIENCLLSRKKVSTFAVAKRERCKSKEVWVSG